jgi:hypothetical protein
MAKYGHPYNPPKKYAKVDPERATRIAKAYEEMPHDPHHPLVKAAYNALARETLQQYHHAKQNGFKAEFWDPSTERDPYEASPRLATEDVRQNHHMYVYPTDHGYGDEPITQKDIDENPLLAHSGEKWNGKPVRINDIFRAVHDYYGHAKEGVGFRHHGEENAWRSHAAMFSPLARAALTSETRGQNSWVNFGPHGEKNRTADTEGTRFADQKIGLMPAWTMHEGAEDFLHPRDAASVGLLQKLMPHRSKRADGGSLFDMSRLHEVPNVPQHDIPRYDPPRGGTERVNDLVKNKGVRDKVIQHVQQGLEMGGDRWYNADPLRDAFHKYHGKDHGDRAFQQYMDFVAATSPRSNVPTNVRNASYYYHLLMSGKPMPGIKDKNPNPYGHIAGDLHRRNAQTVTTTGWDPLQNPKPASFSQNLQGNQQPVTADTHAFRLPGILSKDPRFLETSFINKKGMKARNIQKELESGQTTLAKELKTPAHWAAKPKHTEYKHIEDYYKGIARDLGITPAQVQAAAWVGGGKLTGLESDESKPFMQFVEDSIHKTAKHHRMDPQDVLKQFVTGQMPLR